MSGTSRPALAAAVAAALLAGCGDTGRETAGRTAADSAAAPPPAPSVAPGPRAESSGAIGVRVEQPRPRELVVHGATTAAVQSLQVSVEDGHRVLFGPLDVPVRGGRFRAEFAHEPTDRPTVFVYVADPEGVHQTVVPVAGGATAASGGPAEDAVGPESAAFRIRWPRAAPGDRRIRLEGEARPLRFSIAISRRDTALATESLALEGDTTAWKPFAVVLPVPGGLRGDDVVVLATGPRPEDRELVFQPVRN